MEDRCKVLESLYLLKTERGKGCCWAGMLEGIQERIRGSDSVVSGGSTGHVDMGWEKFNRAADAYAVGFGDMDGVASVMFRG